VVFQLPDASERLAYTAASRARSACLLSLRGDTLSVGVRHEEWRGVVANVSAIGSIGVITVATRGEAGPGEVLIKIRGGTETYIAWSPEPLRKGTTVLVISERGSRTVDVSAWTDPLDPTYVSST
jgi:hypothetical protein